MCDKNSWNYSHLKTYSYKFTLNLEFTPNHDISWKYHHIKGFPLRICTKTRYFIVKSFNDSNFVNNQSISMNKVTFPNVKIVKNRLRVLSLLSNESLVLGSSFKRENVWDFQIQIHTPTTWFWTSHHSPRLQDNYV